MSNGLDFGIRRFFNLIISMLIGSMLWVLFLGVIDDEDMWDFDVPGIEGDIIRLGIIVISAIVAASISFLINQYLTNKIKKGDS